MCTLLHATKSACMQILLLHNKLSLGIPPSQNSHPAAEASGTTHQHHSQSPSPNNCNKCLRGSQVLDVTDSDKSEDGAEMEEEVVVKHDDVKAGFQILLFGSDRGTQSPQNNEKHGCVCRTTYCAQW